MLTYYTSAEIVVVVSRSDSPKSCHGPGLHECIVILYMLETQQLVASEAKKRCVSRAASK